MPSDQEMRGFRWVMSALAHTKRLLLQETPVPREKLAKPRFYRRGYIDAFRQDFRCMPYIRKVILDCGAAAASQSAI